MKALLHTLLATAAPLFALAAIPQVLIMDATAPKVAIDAMGSVQHLLVNNTTIAYTGITVGSGRNRALLVTFRFTGTAATNITATWDVAGANQALTLISTPGGTNALFMYGLVAPVSGNKTLTISWTGSVRISVEASSWTGVNQTGGATSFPAATPTTGTGAATTITVTSAVGDFALAGHGIVGTSKSFSSVDNTQLCIDNGFGGSIFSHASNCGIGAASVTLSTVCSESSAWASVGCDIVRA